MTLVERIRQLFDNLHKPVRLQTPWTSYSFPTFALTFLAKVQLTGWGFQGRHTHPAPRWSPLWPARSRFLGRGGCGLLYATRGWALNLPAAGRIELPTLTGRMQMAPVWTAGWTGSAWQNFRARALRPCYPPNSTSEYTKMADSLCVGRRWNELVEEDLNCRVALIAGRVLRRSKHKNSLKTWLGVTSAKDVLSVQTMDTEFKNG